MSCHGGGCIGCPTPSHCSRCRRTVLPADERPFAGQLYHTFCFSCNQCNRPLNEQSACLNQGEIYCIDCCQGCSPCTGCCCSRRRCPRRRQHCRRLHCVSACCPPPCTCCCPRRSQPKRSPRVCCRPHPPPALCICRKRCQSPGCSNRKWHPISCPSMVPPRPSIRRRRCRSAPLCRSCLPCPTLPCQMMPMPTPSRCSSMLFNRHCKSRSCSPPRYCYSLPCGTSNLRAISCPQGAALVCCGGGNGKYRGGCCDGGGGCCSKKRSQKQRRPQNPTGSGSSSICRPNIIQCAPQWHSDSASASFDTSRTPERPLSSSSFSTQPEANCPPCCPRRKTAIKCSKTPTSSKPPPCSPRGPPSPNYPSSCPQTPPNYPSAYLPPSPNSPCPRPPPCILVPPAGGLPHPLCSPSPPPRPIRNLSSYSPSYYPPPCPPSAFLPSSYPPSSGPPPCNPRPCLRSPCSPYCTKTSPDNSPRASPSCSFSQSPDNTEKRPAKCCRFSNDPPTVCCPPIYQPIDYTALPNRNFENNDQRYYPAPCRAPMCLPCSPCCPPSRPCPPPPCSPPPPCCSCPPPPCERRCPRRGCRCRRRRPPDASCLGDGCPKGPCCNCSICCSCTSNASTGTDSDSGCSWCSEDDDCPRKNIFVPRSLMRRSSEPDLGLDAPSPREITKYYNREHSPTISRSKHKWKSPRPVSITLEATCDVRCPGWVGGGDTCTRCGRLVYHAEKIKIGNCVFHSSCFTCACCRKALDVMTANQTNQDVFCKQCYARNFGPLGYGYRGALVSYD